MTQQRQPPIAHPAHGVSTHLDSAGVPLKVGDAVAWSCYGNHNGTVRGLSAKGNEVRVDNGDPENFDLHTNGFTLTQWISAKKATKISREQSATVKRTVAVVARVKRSCPTCGGSQEGCVQCGWIRP